MRKASLKVLQINAVNGIRSTGRICTEISQVLEENGHEAYIAYATGLYSRNSYKIGSRFDQIIHGILSRLFGLQAYFSYRATKKLLRFIETVKPDVVHLHNLHSNFINLKLLLEHLAVNDIPTVLTLHDCWFYTGKCTHYTIDDCFKWKSGCYECPRLKKDNSSYYFDRTKKMYEDKKSWFENIPRLSVIGVSDWITNEAKQSILSQASNIKRVYNWIDLDLFSKIDTTSFKKKSNLDDKFIILGVASEWGHHKGLNAFIKLADSLADDMRIILIGTISSTINLPKILFTLVKLMIYRS
jgi:glycosyltransferase involved in cell wall biosynthesis